MRAKWILLFCLVTTMGFSKKLKEGMYRAVLTINAEKNLEIPFNFELSYQGKRPIITIRNAEERIVVDEVSIKGDSVNFKMPVFDTEFRTRRVGDDLEGLWINHYKTTNNTMKFKATFGEGWRFEFTPAKASPLFEGRWETTFSPNSKDSSKAIGVFHHIEQTEFVTGTFLTETGDYRYLEGVQQGRDLHLSCFDGSHAFLFMATLDAQEQLNGKFYSGAAWSEEWTAKRNDNFRLRPAEELTFLKNKNEAIGFSFPDTDNNIVSLSDKAYEGKPVIIQVMGSWCPNCMDESRYLSALYKQYKNEGLEIIALAFEKTSDAARARAQVLAMKNRLHMDYAVLITGKTGKDKASETLTALNGISAFPTTLFLDKSHRVVRIHTGFSGPATGNAYELFKQETESLLRQLLKN